jgi:hypothetical protein
VTRIADCKARLFARWVAGASTGGGLRPSVTPDMGPATFLRLVGGASGAPKLMLQGRLGVWGDLVLAARLPELLNLPKA